MALDPLTIASLVNSGYNTLNDVLYNTEPTMGNTNLQDIAFRGTPKDRHLVNQLKDDIFGLFGLETSFDKELKDAAREASTLGTDFSQVNSKEGLMNAFNSNEVPQLLDYPSDYSDIRALKTVDYLNPILGARRNQMMDTFNNQNINISKRQQRNALLNTFEEGGYVEEQNGVTKFNVGGTHSQNPYDGIQQGIASDNLPNLVEEGELKYNDYIYSARLKPSKSLLKKYILPEKYAGKTFAEIGDKLQKESEERPNDPVSKTTLDEWMLRLQNAQEDYKAKAEERRLAKVVDSMSDEEKAILLSSLEQPMAQQEGIDLSQPMYAKGGKIHIAKNKRGTFTAAAKKRGMGVQEFASKVLANPENYTEAMRKKAQFAHNAKSFKHADGGHLFPYGGDYTKYPFGILGKSTQYLANNQYDKDLLLNAIINGPTTVSKNAYLAPVDVNDERIKNFTPIKIDIPDLDEDYYQPKRITASALPEEEIPEPAKLNFLLNDVDTSIDSANKPRYAINTEMLRYAPAIGAGIGALAAALQPKDYDLANRYRSIAANLRPVSAPHIGGYRRYTPYDVNLGDAENLALQTAAINANRGQNRATQGALNTAVLAKSQEANAKRNLAAQQANEANRLAVDTYNLGIDQFNAQRDSQYDQLNQQILTNKLNMLGKAAEAEDASKTAWANMYNTTHENLYNQLGNVGRDEWNRNRALTYLEEHPEIFTDEYLNKLGFIRK